MARVVCVHYDLLRFVRARIEQYVDAEGKVVVEEVTPLSLNTSVGARGMNFHLIFTFKKYPTSNKQLTSASVEGTSFHKRIFLSDAYLDGAPRLVATS